MTDSQPAHLTSTGEKLRENTPSTIQNTGSAPDSTTQPVTAAADSSAVSPNPAVEPKAAQPQPRPDFEDKIPVMSEPPPIKAVEAAPGMSATSGPLEDFPEGEFR